jgi:plasmid stabilization system protein ParE
MYKLYISPEAQNDLTEIRRYISEELENEKAAENTVAGIFGRIRRLGKHALMGKPLNAVIEVDSEYRYLTSDNYLIFCRAYQDNVYIDRVLYVRRDYISILFGDIKDD